MKTREKLRFLEDRWDEGAASRLDASQLLCYRSNLLGSDLRITNFGGGNTSAKISGRDPLNESRIDVLWVKGSGGDLASIQRNGFATLYLEKLLRLEDRYRGPEFEDEMVDLYPLCAFGGNTVAASIDTPLHGFLPFGHVDHLHPDWGIALAASSSGLEKLKEFNRTFGRRLIWLPWQRPGFELGMMMKTAVRENPGCEGIILGGHGLFTWGSTSRECYSNTIAIIDELGQFVQDHIDRKGAQLFGGSRQPALDNRRELAIDILPLLRGRVSGQQRMIASYSDSPEVMRFINSADTEPLSRLGTSCPDHFLRTKIRPLLISWGPSRGVTELKQKIDAAVEHYRDEYRKYYESFAGPDSPRMRDPNPTVVLIPGIGMFSFGKSKRESRITGEFYVNAIHVMEGATALDSGKQPESLPQAGAAAASEAFGVFSNYVSLPPKEAFRIEYWKLEEAKLRRQPPEKELSRRIVVIVGAGSGIGRATGMLAAKRGAHIVIADRDQDAANRTAAEIHELGDKESVTAVAIDIRERDSICKALRAAVAQYGGIDTLVNTAAIFPSSPDGQITDEQWRDTLDINVTANNRLLQEAAWILRDQNLDANAVLTSSANAVVPKQGSAAYDASKAALNHLVREFAVSLAPKVRVNGISPATVVSGSTMFPRDRVVASLKKYGIGFDANASDEQLRSQLADFYARRTLLHQPIDPVDCAAAILFLAGPQSKCTTGHLIPVDGGLPEAFLR